MNTSIRRIIRLIALLVALVITGCVLIPVGYNFLRKIDQIACYKRLSMKLNISPNYEEVSNILLSQTQALLTPGMNRDEVITSLEKIAPVSVTLVSPLMNGGVSEDTFLNICYFYDNNIHLLIYYSEDGKMEEVIRYIGS